MSEAAKGCFDVWYQELRELIKNRKGLNLRDEIQDCDVLLGIEQEAWRTAWEDGDTPQGALNDELCEWSR